MDAAADLRNTLLDKLRTRAWRAGQIDTLAVWPAPWRLDLRRDPPDPETRRP